MFRRESLTKTVKKPKAKTSYEIPSYTLICITVVSLIQKGNYWFT